MCVLGIMCIGSLLQQPSVGSTVTTLPGSAYMFTKHRVVHFAKAFKMHANTFHCITQPNTILLDCILSDTISMIQASPGSAHQCIFGNVNVYLRSDLSRNCLERYMHTGIIYAACTTIHTISKSCWYLISKPYPAATIATTASLDSKFSWVNFHG